MKIHAILITAGLLSAPVYGVTLSSTFTNLQGTGSKDTNVVFSDNTGAVIAQGSGYAAIGTFNLSNGSIASLTTSGAMDSAFFGFGSATNFNVTGGAFQAVASSDPDTLYDGVNTYTGKNVYIVVGNAASLATSTEFLVWDSGVLFANTDPTGAPDQVTLDVDSGTLVVGRDDKDTFDMSGFGGSSTELAFTTVAIPEPSSTALLGLGGLAFLLRRRR